MQNIPGATNSGMRSLEADKRVQSDHLTMSVALSERQPCLLHTGGTGFHASRAVSSTWGLEVLQLQLHWQRLHDQGDSRGAQFCAVNEKLDRCVSKFT